MKFPALVIAMAGISVATVAASPAVPGPTLRSDTSDPASNDTAAATAVAAFYAKDHGFGDGSDSDHHVVVFKKRSYWCQLPGGLNDELWGRAAQNDELSKRFAKLRLCICSSPGVANYDPNHDKTDC